MPMLKLDYTKTLAAMPAGVTWSDVAKAMGRHYSQGSRLGQAIQAGTPIRDSRARELAKALTDLSGAEVGLGDLLPDKAPAQG